MQIIQAHNGQQQISAYNRAVQFGDGHFSTLKILEHKICDWSYHRCRLLTANQRLAFPTLDLELIYHQLSKIAAVQANAVVKILVSRGESQRGYAFAADIEPVVLIYVSDWHAELFSYPDGISLISLDTQLARQPLLAGLKHTNRLEQVFIKQELTNKGAVDGLVFDTENHLIETSLANIFVRIQGQWCTPDLTYAGVAGTKRALLLEQASQSSEFTIRQKHITKAEIKDIEAAVICNALIDFVCVQSIDGRALNQQLAIQLIKGLQGLSHG
ncbi:aminodeoxychorismate lyase [Catenovulum sp. SX2]|uniref:aminodeoxychorismate lyase n=1 Tax=Catenovulum sp. SX2 TaxID=3398614 RepID=UPI003F87B5EB